MILLAAVSMVSRKTSVQKQLASKLKQNYQMLVTIETKQH
jgi:hypothetical protein